MKKIPTIFVRDAQNPKLVTQVMTPVCEWVFAGEGTPTRKRDGTATLIARIKDVPTLSSPDDDAFTLLKRYDAKVGREPPPGFWPAQDPDPKTGHWPGWIPVGNGPDDKWFVSVNPWPEAPGTYEFCGPKVNGNPEGLKEHMFFRHGEPLPFISTNKIPSDPAAAYERLRAFFGTNPWGQIEGIVWHHPDGRMAKIKRRDFGLAWPVK